MLSLSSSGGHGGHASLSYPKNTPTSPDANTRTSVPRGKILYVVYILKPFYTAVQGITIKVYAEMMRLDSN